MEAADVLCDALFHWLENRKECAEELKKLAQKLKDVHQGSNISLGVGAAATVGAISGAVIARDKASPLETAAAALGGTLGGAAVSAISTWVEKLIASRPFKKASELIKKDEKVGTKIQKLLRDLKDRCGETLKVRCAETLKDRCAEALLGTHADELDCEMATLLMSALARRSNTHVPLDLLRDFNRATFFRHIDFICHALGAVNFLVSAKEMMKNIELIGIKAAEAGSEGATGFGISLYDLIVKSKALVKGNQVTEARKILRDLAREIRDGRRKLKGQLDAMHQCNVSLANKQSTHPREIIQKFLQMKRIIENLGGYSLSMTVKGQRVIDYIKGTYTDNTVLSWLQELPHQIEFVNLLRFFQERLTDTEYLTTSVRGHIHIVFVAHGSIDDQLMPAGVLVPTDNIRDTILYSPWNCAIDGDAACAIAQGFIQVADREFYNNRSTPDYEPNPLPDHWNNMRESLHDIPVILLFPVTPEDGAWALFQQFWMNRVELEDRAIIPYLVPKCLVNAFGEIPLYMLIFVTSFLLMFYGKTATVHLAAGLGRGRGTPSSEERERQERERQERERQERERQEWERQERERQERERQERERQERERQERERQERERQERERQERERQERERQQREKPAWFRPKRERQAWERQVKERQERERQEKERQERERQARERQEKERQERERQQKERQERERQQKERQERERQERERQERERQERERQERERQERERQERERQQREKPAWFRPKRERQAWERQVKERQERERQEKERQERERQARERQEKERQERERQERERQERERQERERQERERQERERQQRERQERERQERERQERERQEWLRKKGRTQYAYTRDGTWMSVKMDNRNVDSELYRAFRSLFNTNL